MNNLIIYSVSLIFSVAMLSSFVYFITSKKVKVRDIFMIVFTSVFIGITFNTISKGVDIVDKVDVVFDVPKDFYSDWEQDSISNPISDEILYKHLILMRAPHAKIILAQAKLESANFTSSLYKTQKNFIGMKKPTSRVTTPSSGKGEYKGYSNWEECVTDYLFWMFNRRIDKLSHNEYLQYIGRIYAEDPEYLTKLKVIMDKLDYKKLAN